MVLAPPDSIQGSTLSAAWGGVILRQMFSDSFEVRVSCTIAQAVSSNPNLLLFPHSNLHLEFRLDRLDASTARQIQSVALPFHYQCIVTNTSMLHLIQLLQAELQTPKQVSQPFIGSIAIILITHLLQQWQTEQNQS